MMDDIEIPIKNGTITIVIDLLKENFNIINDSGFGKIVIEDGGVKLAFHDDNHGCKKLSIHAELEFPSDGG